MPSMTPGRRIFSITTGPEWKRVEAELRRQNMVLADQFRQEIRDAGNDLAKLAQAEVMRIPAYTAQHSGLRARVAKGVGTKLTTSGVQITSSMNDKDEVNIPSYLDINNGWRHPVFGNRHVWVTQETGGSWFRDTIAHGQPVIQHRMEEIFQDAARDIGRAGA
jgi:hypothetical protein